MSAIHAFLVQYGLIVVYLGVIIEGESVVVAAGFLAHQHVLNPYSVFLAAFAGSVTGDQLLFFVGRYFAGSRFVQRQTKRPLFIRVLDQIQRNQVAFILAFRFIYGMRTISPIAIGIARVNPVLYAGLNLASAAAWAAIMTTIGYLFGQTVERFAGRLHQDHKLIIAGLLLIGLLVAIGLARSWHAHRQARAASDAEAP
ncbi:DedA family protein [Kaistia nematophila]|uniref:DedA family protein n=1 Tax=Kaistia nematophila TaxID=2994654 RepID=A0A9X3DY91_9HYPH|nr:DedA family protein [Kaistia nematophila]MCX5567854.1 DedA family protein [Kaistia nematophila]